MAQRLAGIRACVFDAYGTLFDVNSAAAACAAEIGPAWGAFADTWRAKQLNYTWLRSLMHRHADFAAVTGDALDFAMEAHRIGNAPLREKLMALYFRLSAYDEVSAVLTRLKSAGLATAILSNGSPAMLSSAVGSAGIGDLLDAVISVEDAGIFKPDPRVYDLALQRLKLKAEDICFLSSNGWDAHGAAAFGFQVVWVNRSGQPQERLPGKLSAEIRNLAELPSIIGVA